MTVTETDSTGNYEDQALDGGAVNLTLVHEPSDSVIYTGDVTTGQSG